KWNGSNCETHIDEFQVVIYPIDKYYTTTAFSGRCQTDTIMLVASHMNQSDYLWDDGTTGSSRLISASGTYWVSYQDDTSCTFYRDSFFVTYPEADYKVSFVADSLVCAGEIIHFHN